MTFQRVLFFLALIQLIVSSTLLISQSSHLSIRSLDSLSNVTSSSDSKAKTDEMVTEQQPIIISKKIEKSSEIISPNTTMIGMNNATDTIGINAEGSHNSTSQKESPEDLSRPLNQTSLEKTPIRATPNKPSSIAPSHIPISLPSFLTSYSFISAMIFLSF